MRFARAVSHAKPRPVLAGNSRPLKIIFPVPVEPRPTSPTLFAKGVFETSKHRNSGSGVRLARGVSHAKPRRSLAGHCRPLKTIFSVPAEPLPTSLTLFAKRVSKDRTMKTVARECDSRGLSLTPSCDACLPDTPECSKTFFQSRWSPGRLPRHFLQKVFLKHRSIETAARECDSRGVSLKQSRDACLPDTPDRSKPFFQFRWSPGRLP